MKIVMCKCGESAKVEDRKLELKEMQKMVGGYIEFLQFDEHIDICLNEEGKLNGLPFNKFLLLNGSTVDVLVGDIFFCSHDMSGETIGLTETQIKKVLNSISKDNKCLTIKKGRR